LITVPSQQKPHAVAWSRDEALDVPRDIDTNEAAAKEWERKIEQARETGNWQAITKDGAQPTFFELRPVPGDVFRKVLDRLERKAIGLNEACSLMFRLALVGVSNLGDLTVKLMADKDLGDMASAEIPNLLDSINPGIVGELGALVYQRGASPRPK